MMYIHHSARRYDEDALERWYEREIDQLDDLLMHSALTQAEYDRQVLALDKEMARSAREYKCI